MESLLYSNYFERNYNCSFYDYNSIPVENRRNLIVGIILLILYVIFEVLYLPCLGVFAQKENLRESCLYCSESLIAMVLALNRCIEMYDHQLAEKIFSGNKIFYWIISSLIYGFILGFSQFPQCLMDC
uniref:Uncharacterized protein n=1 Tax=Meloidogyne enterolobii TaxID=390850 RepID=A0A6V7UEQ2_MELEN|nr:unnamed protein product [Meloidogyne enterolobii]